jgi:hypothetical protein
MEPEVQLSELTHNFTLHLNVKKIKQLFEINSVVKQRF